MTGFNVIPTCFYHPTKVIFLDDNQAFLDALELEFSAQINMLAVTDPDSVLQIIDRHSHDSTKSIFKSMNDVNADTAVQNLIGFEVKNLLNTIYDKTRFDTVAVLVVDYEMPSINGIDFCKKLKDKNVFKVMLTAEADKDTAIKAFNQGIIDKFILKTNENLYQELTQAIQDLTQRYFHKLSQTIINGYAHSVSRVFENKLYQQLFFRVLSEAQAVEYYMVDHCGSFLFIDKNFNPTWLIVKDAEALNQQLELLDGYEVPEQVIASLAKKEKMLFLLSEQEYKQPVGEWTQYMVESKMLDSNYYYSVVNRHLTDSIQWDSVASYASYGNCAS